MTGTAASVPPALPFQVDEALIYGLATSLVLVIVLWATRIVLVRLVRRQSDILSQDQRRWVHTVRTAVWVLLMLGLVMIWAPQLHTVALSLTAFIVAIVIATKEVILCVMGAFMRVSTAPFRVGDWIRIEDVTGEVVDLNAFSAKVQELEAGRGTYQFTGRIIQIPNSRYFTFPIENLSFLKQFRPHDFTIALQSDVLDPALLLKKLGAIVEAHTKEFQADAAQNVKKVKQNGHIPMPDPAPRIRMAAKDFNNLNFNISAYLPTAQANAVADRITRDFMTEVAKLREKHRKEEQDSAQSKS